jgi:hypothetical protein
MADHADGLPDLVTRAQVARRLHLTRAGVAAAMRQPGFPAPLGRLGDSVIWRWTDVRAWAEGNRGRPGGPTDEAMHVAGIRDRFRAAGFRLKIVPDPGGGWRALRIAIGGPSAKGQAFTGATQEEAAERALAWLETHK